MKQGKSLTATAVKLPQLTGKVLCDIDKATSAKELYVIGGVSYNDIALIRLFEQDCMNEVLAKKCYRLSRKLLLPAGLGSVSMPLFADVTKLICKEVASLLPLLNKQSKRIIGKIPKEDMNHIFSLIRDINTIPEHIKSKYLLSY